VREPKARILARRKQLGPAAASQVRTSKTSQHERECMSQNERECISREAGLSSWYQCRLLLCHQHQAKDAIAGVPALQASLHEPDSVHGLAMHCMEWCDIVHERQDEVAPRPPGAQRQTHAAAAHRSRSHSATAPVDEQPSRRPAPPAASATRSGKGSPRKRAAGRPPAASTRAQSERARQQRTAPPAPGAAGGSVIILSRPAFRPAASRRIFGLLQHHCTPGPASCCPNHCIQTCLNHGRQRRVGLQQEAAGMQARIMHGRRARQRAPRRARHRAPPCLRDQGRRPGAPPANTRPSGVASKHSVRPAPFSGALSAGPGPAPGRKCSAAPAGAPA